MVRVKRSVDHNNAIFVWAEGGSINNTLGEKEANNNFWYKREFKCVQLIF